MCRREQEACKDRILGQRPCTPISLHLALIAPNNLSGLFDRSLIAPWHPCAQAKRDVLKALGKESEPGIASAMTKVELWRYCSSLVFSKQGENIDMDLFNPDRNLIHSGKLLCQLDSILDRNWSEVFVLLFDNYRKCCLILFMPAS